MEDLKLVSLEKKELAEINGGGFFKKFKEWFMAVIFNSVEKD